MRGLVIWMVLVSPEDGVVRYFAVVDKHRMDAIVMPAWTVAHKHVCDNLPIQRPRHIGINQDEKSRPLETPAP